MARIFTDVARVSGACGATDTPVADRGVALVSTAGNDHIVARWGISPK